MFRKILIANRGEIACRVAATARRLGVRTVAVYSDADAGARHVMACDEAVALGGAAPRDSYLRWQRMLDAARATGAEAVHPGYGFLSENEDFAQACADAGLVFIGPPPAAIRAMGSKAAAKALMAQAGVPLVPGYHGEDNDPARLADEAGRIGYPVLIKASAGGGGKGMRRVDRAEDFAAALASCQREAQASFGDAHVLVERYVLKPRHIEIQVFADTQGHCIHLGERDCSVQRRHQKVLEESPAPGLTAARRAEMGAAAVAAAQAVGYVGAGTVEFIAEELDDGDLRFYFMEMNTRLQVEHPVTEAVTGLDLVEWQLRVAAGEPLPARQADIVQRGHAIEARICAENPEAGFLPATGRLVVARWPEHVEFRRDEHLPRLDGGFGEGDEITPWYDSMIAKLIVWGEDRAQALARLDAALAATRLVGPANNVAFLRRVVASRSFVQADLDTALIEREHAALFDAPGLAPEWAAAAVVADACAAEATTVDADPWSRRDGWRLRGGARRRFELEIGGERVVATVQRRHDGEAVLELGEQRWPLLARALGDGRHEVRLGDQRRLLAVHRDGERRAVFAPDGQLLVTLHDPIAHAGDHAGETGRLSAPMPGKIVAIAVEAGQAVRRGQALAVLEAMKMEHTITAPRDGVVEALLVRAGDTVAEGSELLRLSGDE
ncbi:acetyl/propionyl/methylcrotonyl-CoA carboxylase subunit alpha [Rubrivivax gelatinosus]|uniref:3-methylcrotonoyl-CoA carboxylase, alpha subunit MccA n=1 Tax=Rubrivivax gelatinosus (strain NBRC 100245 / IL144) TaxID=983917 RepID=I0HXE0_RUBGI|nr:biotin carboxylase N-terminal domain-containing protein [Rubrivivax gelatinosus]BAL97677.1 3-methylcrotonoyl-CoA carboxylase, alpha subunit MccA [Rubrivivax gelatinosus IL144]